MPVPVGYCKASSCSGSSSHFLKYTPQDKVPIQDTLSKHPQAGSMQESTNKDAQELADAVIRWLIDHEPLSWSHCIKAVGNIFFWRSEALMEAGRNTLLKNLSETTAQIESIVESDPDKNLALWAHICHLLSVIPYLELSEGTLIRVPLMHNNSWQVLTMRVGRICLNDFGSPSIAYTLTPEPRKSNPEQQDRQHERQQEEKIPGPPPPALILFMGTAPFTSLGALISVWSDFVPFTMVGQALYRVGKEKIAKQIAIWNNHSYEKKRKVIALGQSLGGALAQLCCAHHPKQVRAVTINAPKVNLETLYLMEKNLGSRAKQHLRVQRFNHEHDWICRVGTHLLPGTRSFLFDHHEKKPLTSQNKVLFNSLRRHGSMIFNAHTKIFPVHLGARIRKKDYIEPVSPLMNRLHQLGCFLFFLPLSLLLLIRGMQRSITAGIQRIWKSQ